MITVEQAIAEFLIAGAADGLKATTLRWYESRLKSVAADFQGVNLDQVDVQAMRQYVISLRERPQRYQNAPQRSPIDGGLSPDTVHGHLRALRRFFSWCAGEYGLESNPMKRIKLPALKQEPKAIDLVDLRRLIAATANGVADLRNRALLIFLIDTGCRAAGALTLTLGNLDLDDRRAIVTEKGDKTRVVPFTIYTAALLWDWIAVRPRTAQTVFCSLHRGTPLTLSGLHSLIRRLKKQAGVSGRVNPHSFRHAFAREYLNNGGDLASLAQLMGHNDVAVTGNYYARFLEDELAQKHDQFSPVRSL